jgi:hypothetical protein
VSPRTLSIALASVGSAYIADLFLRWGPDEYAFDGIQTGPAAISLTIAVALVLWELLGAIGIRRTERSDSLIAFFLAWGTALAGVAAVANLHWGSLAAFYRGTGYGAWVALVLAALLLGGGLVHLVEYVRVTRLAQSDRATSAAVACVGVAYVVDLFLPWGPREPTFVLHGIDLLPTQLGFLSALGLVLWELLGALNVRRTARFDSLIGSFLAAETAVVGVAAIFTLRWGEGFSNSPSYGWWIAIPLTGLLFLGASVHLAAQMRRSRMDS